MQILLIVPDDAVRGQLRERLASATALRAKEYSYGLILAEQNMVSEIVVWAQPGADRDAIDTIRRLRRLRRDARIIVLTPRITKAGLASMIDVLEVDAYLPDSEWDVILETILGVPSIVEKDEKTTVLARPRSSAALN